MTHIWLLILFIRPAAFNHPYTDPVVEYGVYRTYTDCAILAQQRLQTDDAFEEYACVPRRVQKSGLEEPSK